MIEEKKFRFNRPLVSSEILEGEAMIINFENGNYYNLENTSALIWNYIDKGFDLATIKASFESVGDTANNIDEAINEFIAELLNENLIIPEVEQTIGNPISEKNVFSIPVLNKYTDMQDLLLLDPIHDVDEMGWPQTKETQSEVQ